MVGASEGIGGEGDRPTRLTLSFFLSTVAKEGLVALQDELHRITLPDFTGDFKIKHVGRGHYEFHRWGSLLLGPRAGWAGRGGSLEREGEPKDWVGTLWDRQWHSFSTSSEGIQGGNWLLYLLMKPI